MTSFREDYSTFQQLNAEILAISNDSLESHQFFSDVLGGVPFPMLSDVEMKVIKLYGVAKEEGTGAKRSIFVLDMSGVIVYVNPKYEVSNPMHYKAVLDALKKG